MSKLLRKHMTETALDIIEAHGGNLTADSAANVAKALHVSVEQVKLARDIQQGIASRAYGTVKTNFVGSKS